MIWYVRARPRCARWRAAAPVMSLPNRVMLPESIRNSPVMRLNSVVLPAPFCPMMSRRSPAATARFTAVATRRPPNDLCRSRTSSAVIVRPPDAAPPPERAIRVPRSPMRHSRTQPGTSPSGMNTTISTKIAPSTKFQRSM